ncbi:MAG: hypothetical protein ACLP0J_30545 [Solirubrobacteraceae bacterium]
MTTRDETAPSQSLNPASWRDRKHRGPASPLTATTENTDMDPLTTTQPTASLHHLPPSTRQLPGLDRQIALLQSQLEQLYRHRAGRLHPTRPGWGWCQACGRELVHAADGYDTCPACTPRRAA